MTLIVVSVGTDHHRFDRILDWSEDAQRTTGARFVVQRGATPPRTGLDSFEYLPSDELEALMRSADAVVCHGGPGTISLARGTGHRPIVVPRNPALGEHVDDHQVRYTARLAAEGKVDMACEQSEFLTLLADPRPRIALPGDDDAAPAVEAFAAIANQVLAGEIPHRNWRDRFVVRRIP